MFIVFQDMVVDLEDLDAEWEEEEEEWEGLDPGEEVSVVDEEEDLEAENHLVVVEAAEDLVEEEDAEVGVVGLRWEVLVVETEDTGSFMLLRCGDCLSESQRMILLR